MENKIKMCITYSKCGEQIQNEENKFKMWRKYSKCGEQIQNVESFFKVSEKLFKCLYINDCEHVGEGFN